MREQFKPALIMLLAFTVVTGVIYPMLVWGIAQAAFPWQANGSLIGKDGKSASAGNPAAGSALIGQNFSAPGYFWGRLSATGPVPYNAGASSGSNLGPLNPALHEAVAGRAQALRDADPLAGERIPVDLLTASGSGLDPQISPAAAAYQVSRVAAARGLSEEQVSELVRKQTSGRTLGILGEPRVNVLRLNLALDQLAPPAGIHPVGQ